jgi:hypothetical protein
MSESNTPQQKNKPLIPPDAYWDERGDDDWDERDLAELKRSHWPARDLKKDNTSGQPKDSEK